MLCDWKLKQGKNFAATKTAENGEAHPEKPKKANPGALQVEGAVLVCNSWHLLRKRHLYDFEIQVFKGSSLLEHFIFTIKNIPKAMP